MAVKKSTMYVAVLFALLSMLGGNDGSNVAQAQTVIVDPENPSTVIRIENLPVTLSTGPIVYDVNFRYETGDVVYGEDLHDFFPFPDSLSQQADTVAVSTAISNALNGEVPVPDSAGVPGQEKFFIGYEGDITAVGATCGQGVLPGIVVLNSTILFTYADLTEVETQTVIVDPENPSTVIRIENLVVTLSTGPTVYDVNFRYETGEAVYGEDLDGLPFHNSLSQEADAVNVLIAISNTLNGEASVPDSAGVPGQDKYWIGYEGEVPSITAVGAQCRGTVLDGTAFLNSTSRFTYADLIEVETTGNKPPVADAGGPYTAEVDVAVAFDGTGSSDPDGNLVLGTWDFGDGTTASGEAPSHAYSAAGVYYVTLTVTDDAGATDSIATEAVVGLGAQLPVADAGGPYFGAVDVNMTLDGTGSIDPDGSIVAYDWDFGDGTIGTGATPIHAYSVSGIYTVTLTVTDDSGQVGADGSVAVIGLGNLPGMADAGGPYRSQVGVAVAFDGTGSSDPDGSIVDYSWNFGDGSVATGATPSHVYSAAGAYYVTLTVTDDSGVTDSDGTIAIVDSDADNQPLLAVETDGDTATAIRNLEIDGVFYDVVFTYQSSATVYGDPPDFDFEASEFAATASLAVSEALSLETGIVKVGESSETGLPIFRIGFDVSGEGTIRLTSIWESVYDNTDARWRKVTDPDVFPFHDEGSFADLTVLDR